MLNHIGLPACVLHLVVQVERLMTVYEHVGGAVLHARLAGSLDLAIDAPVALRHGGGAGLCKYSQRYCAQDGEVTPIHAPPGRRLHRLGVHEH